MDGNGWVDRLEIMRGDIPKTQFCKELGVCYRAYRLITNGHQELTHQQKIIVEYMERETAEGSESLHDKLVNLECMLSGFVWAVNKKLDEVRKEIDVMKRMTSKQRRV